MKVVGIIAEYNPFHNGHAWHVQQAKKLSDCQGVIAVMSGHFLQRGEPASFDKWSRAKMAVTGGVDLVIELPTAFAVRSAQYFAEGGVRLLSHLGIVSHLCFGAESDDLPALSLAAHCTSNQNTLHGLMENMKHGNTYARAFSQAVGEVTGLEQALLSSPNNILAIEYLRAINNFAPQITPIVIKRKNANYHDVSIGGEFASATAIRRALEESGCIHHQLSLALPRSSAEIMQNALAEGSGPVRLESLSLPLLYLLRTLPCQHLDQVPGVSEGLHYKLSSAAVKAVSIRELLDNVKSKRYTTTRLQRMLIHTLLGTQKAEIDSWTDMGPLYARVLAFNERGRDMLKAIRNQSSLPIITKTAAELNSKKLSSHRLTPRQKMLAIDIKASDIYTLAMPNPRQRFAGWDFLHSPHYIPIGLEASKSQE